jgi:hypothetical protein
MDYLKLRYAVHNKRNHPPAEAKCETNVNEAYLSMIPALSNRVWWQTAMFITSSFTHVLNSVLNVF